MNKIKYRNYGIDLLRIVAMFGVTVLHVIGNGGVEAHSAVLSGNWIVSQFDLSFFYGAVNWFAIISGFVLYNSNVKLKRIVYLWMEIFFYCVSLVLIIFIIKPESRSVIYIINALFPITRGQYWYLSAYFGIIWFIPLINKGIYCLKKRQLQGILLGLFVMICIFSVVLKSNPYELNAGYSSLWLLIMYLVGAYVSKYDLIHKFELKKVIKWFLFWIMTTFIIQIVATGIIPRVIGVNIKNTLYYISPTIVLASINFFLFFGGLHINSNFAKIIEFVSPAALSVYIIQTNPLIWNYVYKNFMVRIMSGNPFLLFFEILIIAFLIYFGCTVIDLIRIRLFKTKFIQKTLYKITYIIDISYQKIIAWLK